jgi:ferredoxin, 2Fe-2S
MKKIKVTFYYDDGKKSETVEAPVHHSLMEASKYYSENNYIPGIDADCGGSCACCTCHVIVDESWIKKVGKPKPTSAEQELLDYEHKATENSRLACQIDLTEKLDGLIVRIP